MINSIDLSSDNFYLFINLLKTVSSLSSLFFFIGLLVFVLAVLGSRPTRKETKKFDFNVENKAKTVVVMASSLVVLICSWVNIAEINSKKISTDRWMLLAQAESTLVQLQVAHEVTNDRPNFDFEQAESWIKNLRKLTGEKDISLGDYYVLVEGFNDLQVGKETIYRWFSDNPTATIKKQLTDGLQAAKNNSQSQNAPEQQLEVETGVDEMDKRLSEVGF